MAFSEFLSSGLLLRPSRVGVALIWPVPPNGLTALAFAAV